LAWTRWNSIWPTSLETSLERRKKKKTTPSATIDAFPQSQKIRRAMVAKKKGRTGKTGTSTSRKPKPKKKPPEKPPEP